MGMFSKNEFDDSNVNKRTIYLLLALIIIISAGMYYHHHDTDKYKIIYVVDSARIDSLEKETGYRTSPFDLQDKEFTKDSCSSDSIITGLKNHIYYFHQLFFSLIPSEKHIGDMMGKVKYLVDKSGIEVLNTLNERHYFKNILRNSTVQSIFCDSIILDRNQMTFLYYGRLRIEGKKFSKVRKLRTEGRIIGVSRSIDNPFGYLITDFRILETSDISCLNKDLIEEEKINYRCICK